MLGDSDPLFPAHACHVLSLLDALAEARRGAEVKLLDGVRVWATGALVPLLWLVTRRFATRFQACRLPVSSACAVLPADRHLEAAW